MKEHLQLLGHRVEDSVTDFRGVVTSVSFDLYGCIQAVVTPPADPKTGKQEDGRWFDVKRLHRTDKKGPVMEVPDFVTVPGPERKPLPR